MSLHLSHGLQRQYSSGSVLAKGELSHTGSYNSIRLPMAAIRLLIHTAAHLRHYQTNTVELNQDVIVPNESVQD